MHNHFLVRALSLLLCVLLICEVFPSAVTTQALALTDSAVFDSDILSEEPAEGIDASPASESAPDSEPEPDPETLTAADVFSLQDRVSLLREGDYSATVLSIPDAYTAAAEVLRQGLTRMDPVIDVSAFSFSADTFRAVYQALLNTDLTLAYVESSYTVALSDKTVLRVSPVYSATAEETRQEQQRADAAMYAILDACTTDDMTDLQKALAVHDYFCTHFSYALDGGYGHNYAHILLEGRGVCQAYADAYSLTMQKAGITCHTVISNVPAHAWNMIQLDGEWFHVDITWDDRYNDNDEVATAYASHRFFLLSGNTLINADYDHPAPVNPPQGASASSTKYESYFWKDIDAPVSIFDGYYYYPAQLSGSSWGILRRAVRNPSQVQTVKTVTCNAPANMGLAQRGGRLYYNTASEVRSCLTDGSGDRLEAAPALNSISVVSRLYIDGDTLYYGIGREAYLSDSLGSLPLETRQPITGVLLPATLTVSAGENGRIVSQLLPANTSAHALVWRSSDPEVLSVDAATGAWQALSVGTAIVTAASVQDESIYGSCSVSVRAATPELEMTNLVIFARFTDDETDDFNAPNPYKPKRTIWTELRERYDNAITVASDFTYANDVDDSFCAYIDAISCGKAQVYNVFPQTYIDASDNNIEKVGYLQLQGTRDDYGDNDAPIIDEVIAAFSDGRLTLPSGTTLDRRESGVLDNLTIVVQGPAEEGTASLMRSHKGVAANSNKLGGKLVRTYNLLCGDMLIQDKAGLIAHEFLHSIGLPDLYRYTGSGEPVGVWDIMATEGGFLQYPLSYQRSLWGWVTLPEITQSGDYYLSSPLNGGGNQGLIIRSPMSESEFFVVEYREKNPNAFLRGFEVKVPESGVIIYRVDTTVENLTNAAGEDYIYLFRDNETGSDNAYSSDRLTTGAALTAGESRGTADFSDTFADRTIFYADGSNSGIIITAVGQQADGRMKITVSYPDYSALGLWEKVGGSAVATSAQDGSAITADSDGNLYVAYIEPKTTQDQLSDYGAVHVKKWNGTAWSDLGTPGNTNSGEKVSISVHAGEVYVGFLKRGGVSTVARRSGGSWHSMACAGSGDSAVQLAGSANALYALCTKENKTLSLSRLNAGKTAFTLLGSQTASYFVPPALALYNGRAVVISNDFFDNSSSTLVQAYDEAAGGWAQLGTLSAQANVLRAAADGDSLWVLYCPQMSATAYLAHYDGESWQSELSFAPGSFTECAFGLYWDAPVLMVAPGNICRVFAYEGDAFIKKGFDVHGNAAGCDMVLIGNTAYVAVTSGDGRFGVYRQQIGEREQIHATDLTLSPAASTLLINETVTISATPTPANTTDSIIFSSLNPAVATVDAHTGIVTAAAPGTATLRATASSGVYADCAVTVYSVPPAQMLRAAFSPEIPAIGLASRAQTALRVYLSGSDASVAPGLLIFSSSRTDLATVDETGVVTANAAGLSGTARISAHLRGDPDGRSVYKDIKIIPAQTDEIVLTITEDVALSQTVIDPDAQAIYFDSDEIPGVCRFRIHATAYDADGRPVPATAVTWSSSDKSIAAIATEPATGDCIVTVKAGKTGAATVTATTRDLAKKASHASVYLRDYAPRLDTPSITLNPQRSAGTEVRLLPSYDNDVTAVSLLVPVTVSRVTTYIAPENLILTRAEEDSNIWLLDNNGSVKNGSIRTQLSVTTRNGNSYTLPLTVAVKNSVPALSVKQTGRFNLFYTDSSVPVTVTAKGATVTNVEFTGSPTFTSSCAENSNIATLRYVTDIPSGKPVTKGVLRVTLDGYEQPVEKAFTLSVETKKPALALSAASGSVNTILGINRAVRFSLIDRETHLPVVLDAPAVLCSMADTATLATDAATGEMTLTLLEAEGRYTGGSAALDIQQSNWLMPIRYSYKVTAVSALPSAKVSRTLQVSAVFTQESALANADITLSQSNVALMGARTSLTCAKDGAEKLEVWYENGSVYAAVTDPTITNGTYAFIYQPHAEDGTKEGTPLKVVTVKVAVSSAIPTAKAKGTIVLNRASCNTENTDAPKPTGQTEIVIDNSRDLLVEAAADGSQTALFSGEEQTLITLDTGKKALEAEKLSVAYENGVVTAMLTDASIVPGSYRFRLTNRYSDGEMLREKGTTTITVAVVDKAPAVKLAAATLKLNRSLTGETAATAIASTNDWFDVTGVTVEADGLPLTLRYSDGYITVRGNGLPGNATYTVRVTPTLREKTTGKEVTAAPLMLKVVVAAAKASASIAATGNLDVLDRKGSAIVYTLKKLSNAVGSVVDAALYGQDAEKFELTYADGKATLTLKDDVFYKIATYNVKLGFTLAGVTEAVYTNDLSVKVTQGKVKLTAAPTDFTLYQSNRSRIYTQTICLLNSNAEIDTVTLDDTTSAQLAAAGITVTTVAVAPDIQGRSTAQVHFAVGNTSRLKIGTRYALVLRVTPKGAAANAKPLLVKANITVRA